MKRAIALLLTLLAVSFPLFAFTQEEYLEARDSTCFESDLDMYFPLNYTYYTNSVSRFMLSMESTLGDNLYYEIPLVGLTSIANDEFNGNKTNYSLLPPVGFVFMACLDKLLEEQLWLIDFPTIEILTLAINSNVYYPVLSYSPSRKKLLPFLNRNYHMNGRATLYIFAKLENDWFMFRQCQWVQSAPGAGLRFEYGNRFYGIYAQTGLENAFQFAQGYKPNSNLNLMFKAGLICNIANLFR